MTGEYYNNVIKLSISGQLWFQNTEVSRWRPAVSNKTILATRQEFFFTNVASVQCITDIVLLDFWLMLLSWMFISSYTQNVYSCVQGEGVSRLMCMYALTLPKICLVYLLKFNLTFIQKRCICQKRLFFSNKINFCHHEISFFNLKLFFRTKVTQNSFNKIEF